MHLLRATDAGNGAEAERETSLRAVLVEDGRPKMQVSPILRKTATGHGHWCPACQEVHILPDSWTFNGDVKKPTFSPSFKHTISHWTGGIDPETHLGLGEQHYRICHYIITDGKIQFCPDSWHGRSDIVMMPLLPPHAEDLLAPEPVPTSEFGKETQD